MDKQLITARVDALRDAMRRQGIHAFIIPSSDPHCGEYVPAHYQSRAWISGFDGSAGTAVITLDDARLWTDSRYFIAAAEQLDGTPFTLMKDGLPGTPSIAQWLIASLPAAAVVAADGWVWDYGTLAAIEDALTAAGLSLRSDLDLISEVWVARPPLPADTISLQPIEYAGESAASKLTRLRSILDSHKADELFVCSLDDVAWTCNIRGNDVHCTPLAVSYLTVTHDKATLFINPAKLTAEVTEALAREGILTDDYSNVHCSAQRVILSTAACNYAIVKQLQRQGAQIIDDNPVARLKAIKNEHEIAGFRQAMRRDGIAIVHFLRWLEQAMEASQPRSLATPQPRSLAASQPRSPEAIEAIETIDELSIDRNLTAFRARQPLFCGLSFDTIAAYGPHAAIVHYEATEATSIPLQPRGLLLLDSGAQYRDGTTDITRTIALGPLTTQECIDYTLVLKGHIALATLRFPEGTSGTRIDAFARYALWQQGMDYGHGTGHGVGSYLSVHEGPHQIRHSWKPAGLQPGMTVTNEPGLYREGLHGIRIENTMLVVHDSENEFGRWCRLEALTLCPIQREPIVLDMLTPSEIAYIDSYHQHVLDELSPLLTDPDDLAWLHHATRPL